MSLTGAYINGISGLMAFSEAMGSVSTNIANTRTVGYKFADTEFATLLGEQINDVNGEESGGVAAKTRHLVDLQGPIETTANPYDVAIVGDGFFLFGDEAVAGGGNLSYSRAGDFKASISPTDPLTSYLTSSNGRYLLAWPADEQGNFAFGDTSTLVPVIANQQADFPGRATSVAKLTGAIPATGQTSGTAISYYGPAGIPATIQPLTANLTFTQTSPLNWTLDVTDAQNAPLGGPFNLTFDGLGNLTSSSDLDIGGLFTLDISDLVLRGTTFERTLYSQNGIAAGDFQSIEIAEDGTIYGNYSSGATVPLYRIPLALFAAPNDLTAESDNFYLESDGSGTADLYKAGDALARLKPGALELSNVDLADSFTRMIVTQRAYNSAAQVVRTVDEMTETIRDLKR